MCMHCSVQAVRGQRTRYGFFPFELGAMTAMWPFRGAGASTTPDFRAAAMRNRPPSTHEHHSDDGTKLSGRSKCLLAMFTWIALRPLAQKFPFLLPGVERPNIIQNFPATGT